MIEFRGYYFKSTGRIIPPGVELDIHNIHAKWLDLVYWNPDRELWYYISTVANPNFTQQ